MSIFNSIKRVAGITLGVLFLLVVAKVFFRFYPNILWFEQLGYLPVYFKMFQIQALLVAAVFTAVFLFVFINLYLATSIKNTAPKKASQAEWSIDYLWTLLQKSWNSGTSEKMINVTPLNRSWLNWLWLTLAVFLAAVFAYFSRGFWEEAVVFFNQTPYGQKDPIFGRDISFYLLSLPFYKFLRSLLLNLTFITTALVAWIYFSYQALQWVRGKFQWSFQVKVHLGILLALLSLIWAWGYGLSGFELLHSKRGITFGASYTDIHALLPAYRILGFGFCVLGLVWIVNIFLQGVRLPVQVLVVLAGLMMILQVIYPVILHSFVVKPNELAKEKPYILNNIKMTRLAYDLNRIRELHFDFKTQVSAAEINANLETLKNIRVWDPRPLLDTLKQIQEIRPYYHFHDVDVDRYHLNGRYQQVMLSARELDSSKIPERGKTWINTHLKYTHGYGVVLNNVSAITPEGLPQLLIKDIPPVSQVNIKVSRSEIYFGERSSEYVLLNTTTDEFDYPDGDDNQNTRYQGRGGIPLKSFLRRLAYAIKFSDIKILISGYVTSQTKIAYDRQVMIRVRKIAPFLMYDHDPYLVIGDDGRLYWMVDGFTWSEYFPYAERFPDRPYNYLRNSVKVVVDAYHGDVHYYVSESETILKAYQKIFPEVFKPMAQMPAGLQKHIRYPEGMFVVQNYMYRNYHMQDPEVFYNQEDLWEIPYETFEGQKVLMDPYFTLMRLPGQNQLEFLLMRPFTPTKKDNMIAWLAARNDAPHYGELVLYKFPKNELIYGPMQVEARIDQDAEISKELALWAQKGSNVIRGNLMVIPMGQSVLYVEPIYLKATDGKIPELKRVVVAFQNQLAMAENLESALGMLLTGRGIRSFTASDGGLDFKSLARRAQEHFQNAQKAMQRGDWGEYGRYQQQLRDTLQQLSK